MKFSVSSSASKSSYAARLIPRYLTYIALPILAATVVLLLLTRIGVFGDALRLALTDFGLFSWLTILLLIPTIAGAGAAVLLAYREAERLEGREMDIAAAVEEVSTGHYGKRDRTIADATEAEVFSRLDEIAENMTGLREQNNELRVSRDRLSLSLNKTESNLLTSKANPAMVRKSLEGIARLAGTGNTVGAQTVAANTAAMMNAMIVDSSQTVSLAGELDLIKRYIENHELVTGQRIIYRLSVICNIVEYRTLPHLILPVVDNFLTLAERGAVNRYEIGVDVTSSRNNVLITVRDNGMGVGAENLDRLRGELDGDKIDPYADTITLANINHRIKAQFGNRYGVKISSSSLGTIVRIYLPSASAFRD